MPLRPTTPNARWPKSAPDERIEDMAFHRRHGCTVVAQAFALCVAGLCVAGLTACGARHETGNERAKPTAITGGERLAWTQKADSIGSLRALTFRLYVDGKSSAFSDVRCSDTPTNDGYECSGVLPRMTAGRHSLEIISVVKGIESPRSSPIIVVVDTPTAGKGGGGT
jgi:hypothetical protein